MKPVLRRPPLLKIGDGGTTEPEAEITGSTAAAVTAVTDKDMNGRNGRALEPIVVQCTLQRSDTMYPKLICLINIGVYNKFELN
jgi:hypothetical protein